MNKRSQSWRLRSNESFRRLKRALLIYFAEINLLQKVHTRKYTRLGWRMELGEIKGFSSRHLAEISHLALNSFW